MTTLDVLATHQSHGFVPESLIQEGASPHRGLALDGPPSGPRFIALLEALRATGGTAPSEVVSKLLQEYRRGDAVSLARLIHTGQLFAVEWRRSLWIPMFQFDLDDLSIDAGVQEVRAALPTLWCGWRVAAWFASPDLLLNGRRPVDVLGKRQQAVVDAALACAR